MNLKGYYQSLSKEEKVLKGVTIIIALTFLLYGIGYMIGRLFYFILN